MPNPESPQRIISDRNAFEIISPEHNRRLLVTIGPNNTVSTRVEQLTAREEQRVAAETYFTSVSRNLIHAMLEQDTARMTPGSEDITPDLAVITFQDQFNTAVKQLAGLRYTDKEVQKLVRTQGQLFTLGQDHIGEMPTIVREKVVSLSNQVSEIYLDMAQKSRTKREQKNQTQTI